MRTSAGGAVRSILCVDVFRDIRRVGEHVSALYNRYDVGYDDYTRPRSDDTQRITPLD